jgi:multiple sugar transport system permease protein
MEEWRMASRSAESRLGVNVIGGRGRMWARQARWGYIFVLPWVIGLLAFTVGPMLSSLYYGFTYFDGISKPRWIGLENYGTALFSDPLFWPSLGKTFYYSLVTVPFGLIGSLLFAMLLNQQIPAQNVFRTVYFMPHLTPTVATAVLWTFVMHPYVGPLNAILGSLGLPQPGWLSDRTWAIPSLIIISLWTTWGGNGMLIFLAGLQGVPVELTEAAQIDGANAWRRFLHVTIPMISPTLFFNLVMGVIGALKVFLAYVDTRGGPGRAKWFFALHIYVQAFSYYRMGYGCALAWLFTILLLVLTLVQVRSSGRWVFYAGA